MTPLDSRFPEGEPEDALRCGEQKMMLRTLFSVRLLLIGFPLICGFTLCAQESSLPIYLDSKRPFEERIDDLMRRMTLKEKVGQLNMPAFYVDELGTTIAAKRESAEKFTLGTYTKDIGPAGGLFTVASQVMEDGDARKAAEYLNELQRLALTKTRLKIPLLIDDESPHGVMYPGGTIYPEGQAIGSSFDLELVNAIYASSAAEARAIGINVLSTLVIELNRDPRLGRNIETYTEDPYLCMRIAESIVRGAQGADVAEPDKVIALLTDFPTQNPPVSGLEHGAIEQSERSLRENDLLPWVGAITKSGALGVMAAYPEVEDVPVHASEKWMTDVLRQELGFEGIVESEGGGLGTLVYEHIVPTQKEAGALALKAGVDVMAGYEPGYMGLLVQTVEEGIVPQALVDRAVRRVLRLKFRLGLFENPYVDVDRAGRVVHSQANRDLALRAAREGIVLLKNDKNLLPLNKNLKSVAVIGPNADDIRSQLGDYTNKRIPQHVTTVIDGIKAAVSPQTKVSYSRGCEVSGEDKRGFADAVRAAKGAEVAIVVVGEFIHWLDDSPSSTDGEGNDVASLDLSGVQEDLVRAVYETGTPTVVVLINGRPLSTRWTAEHVPAVVEAWEPGERGGEAVADVLFGDYNPSGRLPTTIPRHVGQLPVYYNYKPSKVGRNYVDMPATPLYPFGYGLSYSNFKYSNLRIKPEAIRPGGEARVSVDVKNVGDRAGEETVQLYVHETYAPVSLPVKQLRGFERVALKPGETKTVMLTLTPEDLQLLDNDMHWRVVPGDFEIMVGKSSADIPVQGILKVTP
jgi:beta-glucosidase